MYSAMTATDRRSGRHEVVERVSMTHGELVFRRTSEKAKSLARNPCNPLKRLNSVKGKNLDFVLPDLEFVPSGLDFVPKNLDFVPLDLDFLRSRLDDLCDGAQVSVREAKSAAAPAPRRAQKRG
jgi:hypothetical protein